ncbi:MAG: YqgE/AlgH family protein [Holosporaceae bacterium]|jgi:putative transcriptional regulator|nr:YqgE/AlgH family protein [Holosporaceae bacterium]
MGDTNHNGDIRHLRGKILVATPSISGGYLDKSMIYICSHSRDGAMGLVINKRVPEINISDVLKMMNPPLKDIPTIDIYFGGAEEINRCFVLHSDDYMFSGSVTVSDHFAFNPNGDIIEVITSPVGPEKKLLCMGCCIWDMEQLENEVASSYWIPIDPDEALIFGDPSADKWSKALMKIGSGTNLFSNVQGNA